IPYEGRVNRVILDIDDSLKSRLVPPSRSIHTGKELVEWAKDNTYCFSIYSRENIGRKQLMAMLQQDLNRVFGLKFGVQANIEKRSVPCYKLIALSDLTPLRSNGSKRETEVADQKYCR